MVRVRSSRLTVVFLLSAAVIMVAGGVVIASNMGFKLNKGLTYSGAGQIGSNLTSIPFRSPYNTAFVLCAQTGLTSTGLVRATVTAINEFTGAPAQVTCGTAGASGLALTPGKGVIIRQPSLGGTGPTSIILVGSHDPALSLTIPPSGAGQSGSFLHSVVYHTTAVTFQNLCDQIGMTSTGLIRGTVLRLAASTGTPIQRSCGTAAAAAESLVLGEAIILRQPGGKTFTPQHF